MRQSPAVFTSANVGPAFGGIQAPGVTGSYLNTATSFLDMGPGSLGNGSSTDQGAGGGGTSGGGGSGARNPGPSGGGGGTGGFAGGSGTPGGPSSVFTCQKVTPTPPSDPDDAKEPTNPSLDNQASGVGAAINAVLTLTMTADLINPCLGGPAAIPFQRLKGAPICKFKTNF